MTELLNKLMQQFFAEQSFTGMLCYIFGSISMLYVDIRNQKEVTNGLKGTNGLWDAPEWIAYKASWVFPHMLMASGFLKMEFPTYAWMLMGGLILFALTGRWGLEWLASLRSGTPLPPSKPESTTQTQINIGQPNQPGQ